MSQGGCGGGGSSGAIGDEVERLASGGERAAWLTAAIDAAGTVFRYGVFDYEDPLMGSYWAEAALLMPVGKLFKFDYVLHAVHGKGARGGAAFAREAGILRDAARGKGNFGLGSGTRAETGRLGRAWVGDGAKFAGDGKTLVSADGLRQFRPPSFKPNLGMEQANFEQRLVPSGLWFGNGHLDIGP